jgi:putative aminopeptidase FrvX
MDLTALLAELCAVPAPTGAETELADLLQDRWTPRCAEVRRDGVGNVIARVGGSGPRVLVQAHMDQIGYVVRHITDEGFLLLDGAQGDRRNGPERRHHVGQPVRALARDGAWVEGLLAAASGHVLTAEQREEHRALGLHPGAPVVFAGGMREIGRLLVGPSMDDRVGLAAMDALLQSVSEKELRCELWLAATVQEENGVHGARALARHHHWDAAVALDVGLVGDVPGVSERQHATRLGDGPIVVHRDTGIIYDRRLTMHLLDLARSLDLPAQDGLFAGYGSDGLALWESGTPTALLTVPTRYTHTAFEAIDPADLQTTIDVLRALVTRPLP